jgi:hypothetical protein
VIYVLNFGATRSLVMNFPRWFIFSIEKLTGKFKINSQSPGNKGFKKPQNRILHKFLTGYLYKQQVYEILNDSNAKLISKIFMIYFRNLKNTCGLSKKNPIEIWTSKIKNLNESQIKVNPILRTPGKTKNGTLRPKTQSKFLWA